jgi:histidine triad (HIT) family protein
MEDCIFCKIVKGEVPAAKVYEDENVLAFLDIMPATPKKGHVLVIPKKHAELLQELDDDVLARVMRVVKMLTNALMKEAKGVNLLQNNGKTAGQFVKHVHFHIVPRFEDDGVLLGKWETFKYDDGEMQEVQQKIKKLLNED